MSILAIYDVSGIQRYIFSSNRLVENVGSSMLIEKVLKKFLVESIEESVSDKEKFKKDWTIYNEFNMKHNLEIEAEIIYIGGGKAIVCYKDDGLYSKVDSKLAQKVFLKTYSLRVVSAYYNTNFKSFTKDREELIKELNKVKQKEHKNLPLQGISITKQDNITGQPISNCYDRKAERYTSVETFLKNEGFDLYGDEYDEYITNKNMAFLKNIDDIVDKNTDSYVALVHIDGNNMGKKIKNALENKEDYEEAVRTMRNISKEIDEIYKNAFEEIVSLYIKYIEKFDLEDLKKDEDGKIILPIRPIVLNGDDITFICKGNLAIDTVVRFLRIIEKSEITSINNDKISACAGIALARSHFPFYRAYELAEQCCSSAKKKAKVIATEENQDVKSWFDIHIAYNNEISVSLGKVRRGRYNVHYIKSALDYDDLEEYNLLYRPFCISDSYEGKYKWSNLEVLYKKLEEKKWTSSNLEKLREKYMLGESEITYFLEKMKSRGKILDEEILNLNAAGFDDNHMTPYIDIIEIMKFNESLDKGARII